MNMIKRLILIGNQMRDVINHSLKKYFMIQYKMYVNVIMIQYKMYVNVIILLEELCNTKGAIITN